MSDQPLELELERRFKIVAEMDLLNIFPLPPIADSGVCRDQQIKKMLKPFEKEVLVMTEHLRAREQAANAARRTASKMNFEDLYDKSPGLDAEMRSIKSKKKTLSDEAKANAIDISGIMQVKYDDLVNDMGRVALHYQLEQLKFRMLVMREIWPGDQEILPHNMFSWCVDDYILRFAQTNMLYIDMMEIEARPEEMECLKFRMDLMEIMRMIDLLLDDIKQDRSPCNNSMLKMRDALIGIEELLEAPRATLARQRDSMTLALFQYKTGKRNSAAEDRRRLLFSQILHMDYIDPIERRYRINWASNMMEQICIDHELQCKVITDEMDKIERETEEDDYVFHSCNQRYIMMIEDYKTRSDALQSAYETDFEAEENALQHAKNLLQKAKEDYKFYTEQIAMFHVRIAEVREIIAAEEAAEAHRMSRMKLSHLSGRKSKGKSKDKDKDNAKGKAKK